HAFALACRPDNAPVHLHKLLADRQAQPEAANSPRCRAVPLRESLKDVWEITCRNTYACITNAQFNVRIHALEQYLHLASLWSELDRVGKQVPHHLLQARAVGTDDVPARTQDRRQSDAFGLCRWHRGIQGGFHDGGE